MVEKGRLMSARLYLWRPEDNLMTTLSSQDMGLGIKPRYSRLVASAFTQHLTNHGM